MVSNILQKFSEAARILSTPGQPMRECVYGVFLNQLNGIQTDELPWELHFIYDSVKLRLTGVIPDGNISNEEAGYIAADILYLANKLQSRSAI